MKFDFARAARRVGALCVVSAAAFAPDAARATVPAEAVTLIVTDPLPGYAPAAGELNGVLDLATIVDMAGVDPNNLPAEARDLVGQARTWRNAEGLIAAALVVDTGDVRSATEFIQGALDGARNSNYTSFESVLEGAAGFVIEQQDGTGNVVMWRQGHYFTEVFVFATSEASALRTDVDTLATSQATFLQSMFGETPSVRGPDNSPTVESVSYLFGYIFGILLIPGIVVAVVLRIRRNRARSRQPRPMFNGPPPSFPRTPPPFPPVPKEPPTIVRRPP